MNLSTIDDYVLTQILLYSCENLKPLLVLCKRIRNIIQTNNILKILVVTGLELKENNESDDTVFPHELIGSKAIAKAIETDNVECLKFVHRLGHPLDYVFLSATQCDAIECVKYLLSVEPPEIIKKFGPNYILRCVVRSKKCLKYFIDTNSLPPPEDIELGDHLLMADVECLQMLYDYGARYHKDALIDHGEVTSIDINVIKFAHEHGHPKTLPVCIGCNFDHIKYYCELGFQLELQDIIFSTCDVESVKYLYGLDYKFPEDICDFAARNNFDSLKFLHEHGYKITQKTLHDACLAQDEKSMEYVHKKGFQLTSDMYEEILRYGYVDTIHIKNYDRFYYLLNNGCPITNDIIELTKDREVISCFGNLYQITFDAYEKQKLYANNK